VSSRWVYGVHTVSRNLLKAEIDKVKTEHLELLYGIIKLLENGTRRDTTCDLSEDQAHETGAPLDWDEFIARTYGCLADAPISRGNEGHFESRETME